MKIGEALAAQGAKRSAEALAAQGAKRSGDDMYAPEVQRILEARAISEQGLEALRHNAGKPELSQLMWFDLEWLADHCRAGRLKYPDRDGRPNWTLGGKPDAEYVDSMLRHIAAFTKGEEWDSETGTHHMAAVAWNALALLTNNRKQDKS